MTPNEVYESSIDKWRNNKGRGTLSYDSNLDLFVPTKMILTKYFSHNQTNKALVIVADIDRREEWASHLVKDFDYANKIATDHLKFVTADTILQDRLTDFYELVIFDQIDRFLYGDRRKIIKGEFVKFKYILGVTNSPDPDDDTFQLYEHCPVIHRLTKVDIVTHGLLDGIVEYNIKVDITEKDKTLLEEYNEFIQSTIEIFDGSFGLINLCYRGNPDQGISADHYRQELAASKNWSTDIDLSSPYFANLNRYYNPSALYERAKLFYDIIRKRQELLSDNDSKLSAILKIIEQNKDKKILIINKRSAFARKVADTINTKITSEHLKSDVAQPTLFSSNNTGFTLQPSSICVEYHPDVESRPLIDIETNDYFRYKSGANSGKVKQFGVTSLNRIANERFNEGYHTVMSSSNAIPKEAELTIDFILITSSECDTLNQFQYRVNRLMFKDNIKILNLYLSDTKELDKFKDKQSLTRNKIVDIDISGINSVNF